MRPGRETDVKIAQEIFNHEIVVKKRILYEVTPVGERPLKNYSKEIEWAWSVAEKMKVALIPVEGNQWFALAGKIEGWAGPEALLHYLQGGQFPDCGASVSESAAQAICESALVANEKHKRSLGIEMPTEVIANESNPTLN